MNNDPGFGRISRTKSRKTKNGVSGNIARRNAESMTTTKKRKADITMMKARQARQGIIEPVRIRMRY
jgi:hypothetical protein